MPSGNALARELGISAVALSQIVHGKGRFAQATRERVLRRVREVGYAPHAGARAARLKRFDAIALFNSQEGWLGQLNPQMLDGCATTCAHHGRRLVVETVPVSRPEVVESRSTLFAQRVCDALLMNHHLPPTPELHSLVMATGMPTLWLNLNLPCGAIRPDDAAAACHLVHALAGRGRRRLALVDFHHRHADPEAIAGAHYSVGMRLAALRETAIGLGLTLVQVGRTRLDFDARVQLLRAALEGPDAPDGLICYDTPDTHVALSALAAAGRRPGVEVGLVQFASRAELEGRPVSTAVIPVRTLGETAIATLCAAIDGGVPRELPSILVPFTFALEPTL